MLTQCTKVLLSLITIVCITSSIAYAATGLSKADHERMLKECPEFAEAEKLLNETWKILVQVAPSGRMQEYKENQQHWVTNERGQCVADMLALDLRKKQPPFPFPAAALKNNRVDKNLAYAVITRERALWLGEIVKQEKDPAYRPAFTGFIYWGRNPAGGYVAFRPEGWWTEMLLCYAWVEIPAAEQARKMLKGSADAPVSVAVRGLLNDLTGFEWYEETPGAATFSVKKASTAGEHLVAEKIHTNSIGMAFVLIPAGSFMMGAGPDAEDGRSDATPQHAVTISKPFYMGKYEVTQAQWEAVMGNSPSWFEGSSNPVEQVSWLDAQKFIRRLNASEGHTRYRLPTEAEWEYAARAGTGSAYFFGDDTNELTRYAWTYDNSGETTHPVGQKAANPWGLHDVYGNVWEWVQDWWKEGEYAESPKADPKGPARGFSRSLRGGGWNDVAECCRSDYRGSNTPDIRVSSVGIRLVLSPE